MASSLLCLETPGQKRVHEVTAPIGSTRRCPPAQTLGVRSPAHCGPFLRTPCYCDVRPVGPCPGLPWVRTQQDGSTSVALTYKCICIGCKILFPPGRAPWNHSLGLPSCLPLGHIACLPTFSRACSTATPALWNSAVPWKISAAGILCYWSLEETRDFY